MHNLLAGLFLFSLPFTSHADYSLARSLQVGTYNRTGVRYSSHFDLGLTHTIQTLQEAVSLRMPSTPLVAGRINSDMYEQTTESFDILPVPQQVVDNINFAPYQPFVPSPRPSTVSTPSSGNPALSSQEFIFGRPSTKRSKLVPCPRSDYLASEQGTRYAVLHVITSEERALFNKLLALDAIISSNMSLKWLKMARIFSDHADGVTIFYKVSFFLDSWFRFAAHFLLYHSFPSIFLATTRVGRLLPSQRFRSSKALLSVAPLSPDHWIPPAFQRAMLLYAQWHHSSLWGSGSTSLVPERSTAKGSVYIVGS